MLGPCCCEQAFSGCHEQGLLFTAGHRLLITMASLVAEHQPEAQGLWQLWGTGFDAPQHVVPSWARDRTHVPYIKHWTTREAPAFIFLIKNNFLG